MSATVRVYVNGRGVDAPAGGTAVDAVRLIDPTLAEAVVAGDRVVTDSRGLPVAADEALFHGAIFRVVANRSRRAPRPSAVVEEGAEAEAAAPPDDDPALA